MYFLVVLGVIPIFHKFSQNDINHLWLTGNIRMHRHSYEMYTYIWQCTRIYIYLYISRVYSIHILQFESRAIITWLFIQKKIKILFFFCYYSSRGRELFYLIVVVGRTFNGFAFEQYIYIFAEWWSLAVSLGPNTVFEYVTYLCFFQCGMHLSAISHPFSNYILYYYDWMWLYEWDALCFAKC